MGLGSQVPRRCRVPLPGCRPTRQAARDPHIASCATANNRSGFVDLHGIRANATSTGCMPGSPPYVRCRRESLARRPFRQTLPPQHPAETHGCARDVARRAETRTRIREAAIGFERGLPRSGQSPTPSAFSPPNHGRAVSGSRDGPVVLVNIAYLRSGRRTLPSMVVLNTTVPHAIAWVVSVGTLLLALAVVEAVAAVAATDSPLRGFGSAAAVLP